MFFLGVDGGGTKTSFALMDGNGIVKAMTTKGNADILRRGAEAVRAMLEDGISQVCQTAGINREAITYSVLGIPSLGDEIIEGIPKVEEMIRGVLRSERFLAVNDVEVGWAGSLACQPGIHLVAGTGAIGYGVDALGNKARSSGWGPELGDEGSAHWIGHKLLSLFSREADEREARTGIYDLVRKEFNLTNDFELFQVMSTDLNRREAVAGLAVLLYQLAINGETKAIQVFEEAAKELSLTSISILRRLQFNDGEEIPVSYSGGVFKSGPYVLEPLQKLLTKFNAKLIQPRLEPVQGAVLYAYKLHNHVNDVSDIALKLQKQI